MNIAILGGTGSGALYVAWQDGRWTGKAQATLIVSRDGGATWSKPMRVSDGPDDAERAS